MLKVVLHLVSRDNNYSSQWAVAEVIGYYDITVGETPYIQKD
jgi:hypothetical protein